MFMNFKFIIFSFLLIPNYLYACEIYTNQDILDAVDADHISGIVKKSHNDNFKYQFFLGKIYAAGIDYNGVNVKRDLSKGIPLLKSASEHGVGSASYVLAYLYKHGEGVDKDEDKYVFYLKKSAECGDVSAQVELAHYFNDSRHHKYYSLEKAAKWYEKSAENGSSESILAIARFYKKGVGVDKNYSKAFYWLSQGFKQDDPVAELWLGEFYENGWGTDKDLVMAYMMYDLGGTAGVDDKERIAPLMTQEQIREAIKKSHEWQEEHHSFRPGYSGLKHQSDGSYR